MYSNFIARQVIMIRKIVAFVLLGLTIGHRADAQKPVFMQSPTPWADSLFQNMTLDQKIGQLFMVAAWSDPKHASYNPKVIQSLISNYHIGGLIFMQGSPGRQAILNNQYQATSKVPLMIGMDAEWGLGMRLDSTISYPRQLTLGATNNEELIYAFGKEAAHQLTRLGVHVSFSPVVDINNNPKNPVISNRSFGEDKNLVTAYSLMYMKGLQDNGVLACAKHFPGHGDTDVDSHKDLPVIKHDVFRMDSVELYPYKVLLQQGLGSVMTAHLYIPSMDSTKNLASTLSKEIITNLLRKQMGFDGLVFTDAINMQGIAKFFKPGDAEVRALIAGNDVLLFSQNVPLAVERIKAAIADGTLTVAEIEDRCLRILRAKEWQGLNNYQPVKVAGLYEDLNNYQAQELRRKLVEQSITVLKNEDSMLPLQNLIGKKVAVVSVGVETPTDFQNTLAHYSTFTPYFMEKNPDFKKAMWWREELSQYDIVIAALLNTSNRTKTNYGVTNESARILNSVGEKTQVILSVFANPYALDVLKDLNNIESLVVAYQDDAMTQQVTAEVIAGAISADGSLPVTANNHYKIGNGYSTRGGQKLRWVNPISHREQQMLVAANPAKSNGGSPAGDYEEDMMADGASSTQIFASSNDIARIDAIALNGIKLGAYPGCRVLVAKNGAVVYDKSFGVLDNISKAPVTEQSVYDLASVTKIASCTLAAMKMVDDGLLDVNKTLGDYLDIPSNSDYSKIIIRDMLAHTAGLTPWIPFYQKTIKNGQLSTAIYRKAPEAGYSKQVAQDLYIMDTYSDTIFQMILKTPLTKERTYNYSDLGYYFLQRIVENQTNQTLDEYLKVNFYEPLGLSTMGYNPVGRIPVQNIAPTEKDNFFRSQHLQGYVHDQGAAMMGGVAGHAGLFSNAQDLAVILQMLLNGGTYGEKTYISKATIDLFNKRYYSGNRRGLGFDKPALIAGTGSTCKEASTMSFGHTGFTGTMAWADPSNGLVYIFLSNRVNPDAENKKIQSLNIRTDIQEEIYRIWGK
jgi:beta-N-acetylhexosaminidase